MSERKPQVTAVVGLKWGDEGKGRIVDALEGDVYIRCQGGDNAGHTIVNQYGENVLHLFPAGSFRPRAINIIGDGVLVNLERLKEETTLLEKFRVYSPQRFHLSENANLIFQMHQYRDSAQEQSRGKEKIGTTNRGIGPAAVDRADRSGIEARLLHTPDRLLKKLEQLLKDRSRLIDEPLPDCFRVDYYEDLVRESAERFASIVGDTSLVIDQQLKRGSHFILEGGQGALLDLHKGIKPFTTSTNTTAAGLLVGAGMPPLPMEVVGVIKAYESKVGEGAFPTEIDDERAKRIREFGHEYGATTGRPRRIGEQDLVALKYAAWINGVTQVAITRLDILTNAGPMNMCDAYEIDGQIVHKFTNDDATLKRATPIYPDYLEFPTFTSDITPVRRFDDLPRSERAYCLSIATAVNHVCPNARLAYVGVGAARDALIRL